METQVKTKKQRRFERRLAKRRDEAWVSLVGKIALQGMKEEERYDKKETNGN